MRQPIETAPRDGTPIRIFTKDGCPEGGMVVWWGGNASVRDGDPGCWISPKGIACWNSQAAEWEPIKSGEVLPFALPDAQLCALSR